MQTFGRELKEKSLANVAGQTDLWAIINEPGIFSSVVPEINIAKLNKALLAV